MCNASLGCRIWYAQQSKWKVGMQTLMNLVTHFPNKNDLFYSLYTFFAMQCGHSGLGINTYKMSMEYFENSFSYNDKCFVDHPCGY